MNAGIVELLYLVAAIAFIVGIKRLQSPRTARQGNQIAAAGMLLAVVVTLLDRSIVSYAPIVAGLVVGGAIGAVAARRVQMTAMPQLVAAFNGFGGGASALVAAAEFVSRPDLDLETGVTIALSTLIGAITFTGSFVAFAKLQGLVSGRPTTLPGQIVIDGALALVVVATAAAVATGASTAVFWTLLVAAALLGITRVMPIGGADMPVVIAFLNSLSGLAAAAAGFVIDSSVLIISGALVGASGLILTNIMVKAMNRTLADVLFGTFGAAGGAYEAGDEKPVRATSPEDVAINLAYARKVIVVPGYGLAVAQAQHALRKLFDELTRRGVDVQFAIHPVAGRMPGHMNVLLAEADIPYDRLHDLDDINPEFPQADVALVVGANDVVNPAARDDPSSPIYGMPILDVDKAKTVVVIKRSLSPGFAGIDNPLFYKDNTLMLFDDAKAALERIVEALEEV